MKENITTMWMEQLIITVWKGSWFMVAKVVLNICGVLGLVAGSSLEGRSVLVDMKKR